MRLLSKLCWLRQEGLLAALLLRPMTRAASGRFSQDGILGFRVSRGHYWELGPGKKLSPVIILNLHPILRSYCDIPSQKSLCLGSQRGEKKNQSWVAEALEWTDGEKLDKAQYKGCPIHTWVYEACINWAEIYGPGDRGLKPSRVQHTHSKDHIWLTS